MIEKEQKSIDFRKKFLNFTVEVIFLFSVLFSLFLFFVDCLFANVTMEQIIFHFRYAHEIAELQGVYVQIFGTFGAAFVIGALVLRYFLKKMGRKFFIGFSLCYMLTVITYAFVRFDVWGYVQKQLSYSDFYEKNYVRPDLNAFALTPDSKNVVILFLESMDAAFADDKIFAENLLPHWSSSPRKLGEYYQIYGSGWTIAGMTTALCSVPLTVSLMRNFYDSQYDFLPHAVCLPDIFSHLGYENYYISGSTSHFGGIDALLKNHGFPQKNVFDFSYFHKKNQYQIWGNEWGYPDEQIYAFLKEKILSLQQQNQKFFIVANSIDTHYPYAFLSKNCAQKYGDWRDVVLCADQQAAEFVQWFEQSGASQNTVLLVIADHASIDEDIVKKFSAQTKERCMVNWLIASEKIVPSRRFSGLDIMPTILDAGHIQYAAPKMGLGVSVFDKTQPNLLERLGLENLDAQLQKKNKIYDSFL